MAVDIISDQSFTQKIKDEKRIGVKYYADWCGSCRLFAPKFRRLSEDERYKDISFIDVNAEENPLSRKAAGVTNLPFFATFKEGLIIDSASANKEEVLVSMLYQLKD